MKERRKEKEEDRYANVPDCFGCYGLTDDCVGCSVATECEEETSLISEEEEYD